MARRVKYSSKVFTSDSTPLDKQIDDIDDMFLKQSKRPTTTTKKVTIDIDLNDKYYRTQDGQPGFVKNIFALMGKPKLAGPTKAKKVPTKGLAVSQSAKNLITVPQVQSSQEFQDFVAKNNNKAFKIADCVIKGTKIQYKARQAAASNFQMPMSPPPPVETGIQTDPAETIVEEQTARSKEEVERKKEKGVLFQGAYVKIFEAPKEIAIKNIKVKRAQSAHTDLRYNLASNKARQKLDIEEFERSIKQGQRDHFSIFGHDKKAKVVELDQYLQEILEFHQQDLFQQNGNAVNQSLAHLPDSLATSTLHKSSDTLLKEFEIKSQAEQSQINSTGFRMRAMSAKYGASVDLVSHGFKKFNVKDVERFFDPLRLKLLQIPLSEVPNPDSKVGSDYYFILGLKSLLKRDYSSALNSFSLGISGSSGKAFYCKFNKGVVLFKLGLFQEALALYRELAKEQPLDVRAMYNRAVCELQNGRYKHCAKKIDKFIAQNLENKQRPQYGQKKSHQLERVILHDLYRFKGIACIRSKELVEASRCFVKAQELKQQMEPDEQLQVNSSVASPQSRALSPGPRMSSTTLNLNKDFTAVVFGGGQVEEKVEELKLDDQEGKVMNIRVRPMTAKVSRAPSMRQEEKLETLREEEHQSDNGAHSDDMEDSFQRMLDQYDEERRQITSQIKRLQSGKLFPSQNRNLTQSSFAPAPSTKPSAASPKLFSPQSAQLLSQQRPRGCILEFVERQREATQAKEENKQFRAKMRSFEASFLSRVQSDKSLQFKQSAIREEAVGVGEDESEVGQVEDIVRIRENYYLDDEKKVKLENVLLGFDVDFDSLTEEEKAVRKRHERIEREMQVSADQYDRQLRGTETQEEKDRNIEFFAKFMQLEERPLDVGLGISISAQMFSECHHMSAGLSHLSRTVKKVYAERIVLDSRMENMFAEANAAVSGSQETAGSKQLLKNLKRKKQAERKTLLLQQFEMVRQEFGKGEEARDVAWLVKALGQLKFFGTFPKEICEKLVRIAKWREFEEEEVVFRQGDKSHSYFVVIRGSVVANVVKEELHYIPLDYKVAYEGDYFGEWVHFNDDSLNIQRSTCRAATKTYALEIDKALNSSIVNAGMQELYEERVAFLRKIDIFADVDIFVLLPLASSITVRTYKMGEYIVRAGENPEGLIIISKGYAVVCAEKLAMRADKQSEYVRIKGKKPNVKVRPTGAAEMGQVKQEKVKDQKIELKSEQQKYYSDSLQRINKRTKTFQNEQILVDDNGQRIKGFTVYKDLMVFFKLFPHSYFGGRVLLPMQQRKRTADEKAMERRGGWVAAGRADRFNERKDFEHLFVKRRCSRTTQNILENERASMLSVIAQSSDVEVYLIDQKLMEFLPEGTQKHIWSKLLNIFEVDRPYMLKNLQKIKDKFREWDVYKINTIQDHMKNNYCQRNANYNKITTDR